MHAFGVVVLRLEGNLVSS